MTPFHKFIFFIRDFNIPISQKTDYIKGYFPTRGKAICTNKGSQQLVLSPFLADLLPQSSLVLNESKRRSIDLLQRRRRRMAHFLAL